MLQFSGALQSSHLLTSRNHLDVYVDSMMKGLERHDAETVGHVDRVAELVCLLYDEMQNYQQYQFELMPISREDLHMGGRLHDVGKTQVPYEILTKPAGLTDEEFDIIKGHSLDGARMLVKRGMPHVVRNMAQYHHERWDGRGYPNNTSGEDIPLEARMAAIIDVFDALASERSYKAAFPYERVMQMIAESANSQFDPHLVDIFINSYEKFVALHSELQQKQQEQQHVKSNVIPFQNPVNDIVHPMIKHLVSPEELDKITAFPTNEHSYESTYTDNTYDWQNSTSKYS